MFCTYRNKDYRLVVLIEAPMRRRFLALEEPLWSAVHAR
jgi:hypothetical protein